MKMLLKSTLTAALLVGAAMTVPTIATAGVNVSVGIGAPDLVYSPGPGYSPYEGQMYYDPIYFGGAWYHGPYRWRVVHGQRVFWVDGGWHRNEWRGRPIPGSLRFSNGGYYRGGRYEGFGGADRINARFTSDKGMQRSEHPDMKSDRGDMQEHGDVQQDRGNMQNHGDMRQDRQERPSPAQDDSRRNDSGPPHN
jgi:hypothetical protein